MAEAQCCGDPQPEAVGHFRAVHAEDAATIIEELAGGTATAVGWSRGASVALLATVIRPELVRAAVLIEPPYHPGMDFDMLRFLLKYFVISRLRHQPPEERHEEASRWVMQSRSGRQIWDELSEEFRESHLSNLVRLDQEENRFTRHGESLDWLRSSTVAKCPVPVTFVLGEESNPMFHRAQQKLAKALPTMRTITVPGTTHALPLQDPDAVVAAIREADKRARRAA